jgi:hypothetical protein
MELFRCWNNAGFIKISAIGKRRRRLVRICLMSSQREWSASNLDLSLRRPGQPRPPALRMARVDWSGPKSSALSMERRSASLVRALLTLLLMVPTAHSQIAAASS